MPEETESKSPQPLELEVVTPKSRSGGRPLYLDKVRFRRICRHIAQGFTVLKACQAEDVCYETFRRKKTNNPVYQALFQKALALRQEHWLDQSLGKIAEHSQKDDLRAAIYMVEHHKHVWSHVLPNGDTIQVTDEQKQHLLELTRKIYFEAKETDGKIVEFQSAG